MVAGLTDIEATRNVAVFIRKNGEASPTLQSGFLVYQAIRKSGCGYQEFRVSGVQGIRSSGYQGNRVSGEQGIRGTGYQGNRVSGYQGLGARDWGN